MEGGVEAGFCFYHQCLIFSNECVNYQCISHIIKHFCEWGFFNKYKKDILADGAGVDTCPQNKIYRRRGLFYPKDHPFLILYVLKLEPGASAWHVRDMRPAGVCLPAEISPPIGPQLPRSHQRESVMHPRGSPFSFSIFKRPES